MKNKFEFPGWTVLMVICRKCEADGTHSDPKGEIFSVNFLEGVDRKYPGWREVDRKYPVLGVLQNVRFVARL